MTFDPNYYTQRKQELQADFNKAIFEAYEDVEKAVIRKLNKQRDIETKFKALEEQEKVSQEATKKAVEPAKPKK